MVAFLRTFLLGTLVILTLNGCNSTPKVEKDGWVKIATKTANFKSEEDVVDINNYFSKQKYDALKLTCIQGTVNIKDINVSYADGKTQSLQTLGVLTTDSSTRPLILNTKEQTINKITLSYKSLGSLALNAAGVTKKRRLKFGHVNLKKQTKHSRTIKKVKSISRTSPFVFSTVNSLFSNQAVRNMFKHIWLTIHRRANMRPFPIKQHNGKYITMLTRF